MFKSLFSKHDTIADAPSASRSSPSVSVATQDEVNGTNRHYAKLNQRPTMYGTFDLDAQVAQTLSLKVR